MNKTQDKIKWLFGDINLKQDISKDKNKNKMIKRKETRFEKLENRIKAIGGFLMKQNHQLLQQCLIYLLFLGLHFLLS